MRDVPQRRGDRPRALTSTKGGRVGLALGLALLLASCSGADATAGGASDLPGEVPEDVSFVELPEDAMTAPDFPAELLDGTPITASELWEDRPVVLLFTASWCETCADLHRELADLVDDYDGAVTLLGVVREEDAEDATEYAENLRAGHPIAAAGLEGWEKYAAEEPPLVALVAHDGTVLRGWPGGVEPDVLRGELDGLIAGAAAAPADND